MRSSLFWDVVRHILVVTDVSGQSIGPILRGQADCLTPEHPVQFIIHLSSHDWTQQS